jgi:hypothetical protein
MTSKLVRSVERVIGRFFRAPFENLPPEYGDPVPPELREFEAEAEASQREITEVRTPEMHGQRSHPARQDEWLERE